MYITRKSNRLFSSGFCNRAILDQAPFFAGIFLICTAFLIFKSFGACAYAGDEHVYFFQGWLISEGYVPYRDFSMAHPPLQALLTSLLFRISGYQFYIGRLLPVLFCLAGGCLLSLIVRREIGATAALSAMALYLLSYEPLRASTHFTGINMTCALLLGSFYALRRDHFKTAGFLSSLAVFTRLYALPFICVFAVSTMVRRGRLGVNYIFVAAFCIILFSAAIIFFCGYEETSHNLINYHLMKTPMAGGAPGSIKTGVLFHNSFIAILTVLSVPVLFGVLLLSSGKQKNSTFSERITSAIAQYNAGLAIESLFAFLVFLSLLAAMDRIWAYYFVLLFPFAAVASGWLIQYWITGAIIIIRKIKDRTQVQGILFFIYGVSLSLAIFGVMKAPALEQCSEYYQQAINKPRNERIYSYTFHNSILPRGLARFVQAYFWKNEREIGQSYWFFHYLLWHESRYLNNLDDMVAFIKKHTGENEEIFGDSGTVPLLALESGRRIAANQVDTNLQRYHSGHTDIKHIIRMIDTPKTRLVILRRNFGIGSLDEIKLLVDQKYSLVKTSRNSEGVIWCFYERR